MSRWGSWRQRWRGPGRGRVTGPPGSELAEVQGRLAAAQLDLRDRDDRIAAMQREYETLQASTQHAAGRAGDAEIEKVFKRLVGTLSNLSALADWSHAGRDVEAADLAKLITGLEKELARCGLERIGTAGTRLAFDVACHQRMSGGSVHAGTAVEVHLPGYRFGGRVLLKAMVSTAES